MAASNSDTQQIQRILATFPPEIQAMMRDFSKLRIEHKWLLEKHRVTFDRYKSLHAAMIVLLKRADERTVRLHIDEFAGVLFDEYLIELHEDQANMDFVFQLKHKSEAAGGVQFKMPEPHEPHNPPTDESANNG